MYMVPLSCGLTAIGSNHKQFFQDDAQASAWITDRRFRDASIEAAELWDLLRICNGQN